MRGKNKKNLAASEKSDTFKSDSNEEAKSNDFYDPLNDSNMDNKSK